MAEKSAKRRVYIYIDGSQVANSVDAISKELRKVQNDQKKMVIGSEDYIRAGRKITQLNSILKQHSSNINQVGQSWLSIGKITDGFNRFFGLATSIIAAITGITFAIRKSVDEFAALEEKEADVRKYTGMTKNQVKDLNEEFKKMDTRTSREQLNSLAADAGRLGKKSKQDILEFVEAADIINVSLGEDLGKDAIKNIGKLAEMFGTEGQTLKEGMLSVGSAINEIAQNSSASEPYLVEFAARLAGTSKQAGISISNLLGFGSALDQNMNQVEMASTALQTLMLKLYQSPAKFAKMAGKDIDEFTKLMKTDANEALLQLLSNLKKIGGLDKLAPMFKEMGLDGVRASGVINTLATNVDKIRKEQETANKAYKEGTSVINEFTIKNNTLQASFDKAKKKFKELSYELGEKLSPYMANFISLGGSLVKVLSIITDFLIKNSKAVTALTIAGTAYVVTLKLMELWTKRTTIVTNLAAIANGLLKGSLYLLQVAYFSLTGQMSKARGAMVAFNLVTKLHPIAALVSVIAAVVTGFALYVNHIKNAINYTEAMGNVFVIANKNIKDEKNNLELLWQTAQNELLSKKKRQEAIEAINKISPEYLGNISLETINTDKAVDAKKRYLDILLKEAMAKAAADKVGETFKKKIDLEDDLAKADKNDEMFDQFGTILGAVNRQANAVYKNMKKAQLESTKKDLETYKELFQTLQGEVDKATNPQLNIDEQLNVVDLKISALQHKMSKFVIRNDFFEVDNKAFEDMESQMKNLQAEKDSLTLSSKNLSNALEDEASKSESLIKIQEDLLENAKMKPDGNYADLAKKNREIDRIEKEITRLKGYGVVTKKEAKDALTAKKEAIEQEAKMEQAASIMKYATGTTTKSEYNKEMLELDRKYILKKMILYKKDSLEYAKLNMDYQQTFITEKERTNAKSLKDLDKTYQEEKTALTKSYTDKNISKKAFDEELLNLDLTYLKNKRDIYKKGSEEWQAVQNDIDNKENDAKVKKQEEFERKLDRLRKSYKKVSVDELRKSELDALEELYKDKLNKDEEYLRLKKAINEKYDQEELENDAKKFKDKMAVTQESLAMLQSLMSAYSEFISASQEAEEAQVNKKYDSEIKAAGKNSTKTKQLEEKKEKEIAAIKSKYADKAFSVQIAMAIASTASAAINAYASASKVNFILGPIAAAMAVAAGAIQIANITKQHEAAKAGYFNGGYTASGRWDEEQGVVHSDEFVANRFATANSTLRPVFDVIDYAQRTGTVASLTREDLAHALSIPGYYNGGYAPRSNETSKTSATPSNDSALLLAGIIEQNTKVMERVHQRLSVPLEVINTVDGEHGMKKAWDEYNGLISNKTRS